MKRMNYFLKAATILLITLLAQNINAERKIRFSPLAAESFMLTMTNINQTAANKLEFDVYLLDTDPAQPFQWAGGQFGIWINTLIFNGGTISVTYNNTNSGVLATQQFNSNPNTATTSGTQTLIKLAGRTPPGAGNGTIIPTTAPGALITHFIITSSVNFPAGVTPDLAFATNTYSTVVAEYISNVNTVLTLVPGTITTPGVNAIVNGNPVLGLGTGYNQNEADKFQIYSKDRNIFVNCPVNAKQIFIYDMLGSSLMFESNVSGIRKFDLNNYPKAYYFVKIFTEDNVYTQKVLLK